MKNKMKSALFKDMRTIEIIQSVNMMSDWQRTKHQSVYTGIQMVS